MDEAPLSHGGVVPILADGSPFDPVVGERKARPMDVHLSLNRHQTASVPLEVSRVA